MFNNFQNLFQKYSEKVSLQKDLEGRVLEYIKEFSGLTLTKSHLKVNQKDKTIKVQNLESAKRFVLSRSLESLKNKIKKELDFHVCI